MRPDPSTDHPAAPTSQPTPVLAAVTPAAAAHFPSHDAVADGRDLISAAQRYWLPRWVSLTRQYLAGDLRAGVKAASSVARWNRRYFPQKEAS